MIPIDEKWILSVEYSWRRAIKILLTIPNIEEIFWLRKFPSGSCDITAFVIGNILADRPW
jgi:hypothetical protein